MDGLNDTQPKGKDHTTDQTNQTSPYVTATSVWHTHCGVRDAAAPNPQQKHLCTQASQYKHLTQLHMYVHVLYIPPQTTHTHSNKSPHTFQRKHLTHTCYTHPPQLTLPNDSSSSCSVAVMADARTPRAVWFTWGEGSARELGSLHTTHKRHKRC